MFAEESGENGLCASQDFSGQLSNQIPSRNLVGSELCNLDMTENQLTMLSLSQPINDAISVQTN